MLLAYGITAQVSLCMVQICIISDKKRDLWLLAVFGSVAICNLGYFMLALSQDLASALNANRIAYLGSVFLPFFILMMVMRFCGFRRSRRLQVCLAALGILMLGIATTPGILPIYYSSVELVIRNGIGTLVREYGPLHMLYTVYLLGYMVAMVAVAVAAIVKRRIRSVLHTWLLLGTVLCNVIIWSVEKFLPRGFEWLSISYILTECMILVIYRSMQRQGLLRQEGRTMSYTVNVVLAVFLLLFANMLRVATMNAEAGIYEFAHIVVLMIYLGILVSWSISVHDRIVNLSIRRYLIALVGLMMLWMFVRTLRFTVFHHVLPMGQWCWYAYYIPMILIPQLCLMAAKFIGKPEEYRLSRKWYWMYLPSGLLILGILTNDLHQLAFRFHMGYAAGWDIYQRSFLYYGAVVWIFGCIALMIRQILMRCRVPGAHKTIWLPIAMIGVALLYTVLYTIDSNLFGFIEVTAALCFTVVAIWESCIKTGLIQSNTHYDALLANSGLGVSVADKSLNIRYRSRDALPLAQGQMEAAIHKPMMMDGGIRISGYEIRGGYTFWQEDISQLMGILEELAQLREELRDSNAVTMQNYQMDRKIRALAEKNRLHDALYRQTAHQTDLMEKWLEALIHTQDPGEKRELLRRIVAVGAYIKRRNNLILVAQQNDRIPAGELEISMDEIMRNLRLAGICCGCTVQLEGQLPAAAVMEMLDFFEYVVESAFDGLESLLVRFFCRGTRLYVCMDAGCALDLSALASDRITVSCTEENGYTLSYSTEGGDGA